MGAPKVGVLALQGDVREHLRALRDTGAEVVPVRRPGELEGLDGLVVPGGESTTIGKLAVTFGMLEPLREFVQSGRPVYGSCAGMILLADQVVDGLPGQPLIGGLDVVVRRNAFGRQVDSFEADLAIAGIDEPLFHAVFIRAPVVEKIGADVEILGTYGDADTIVAVRQGNVLATAFHPELTGDNRVHALFVGMVKLA